MRVLMISKACIVGIYQRKLEAIARHGVELLVLVPPSWRDERGETRLERAYTDGYRLEVVPIYFNGNFHLHTYGHLARWMRQFRPQIVHIDEEPYNLATWQALHFARQIGAKSLFFSWQNIHRRYPFPFNLGERWVMQHVDYALMGTSSAAAVWREKGYTRPLAVVPQFGTDTALFRPPEQPDLPASMPRPLTIGYAGRLVSEKGLSVLLAAAAQLSFSDWRLRLIGGGPLRAALEQQAAGLGIADRVAFSGQVTSAEMPAFYAGLDVLVLASLTRPNWKEQFGRTLVEAMASGVAVIGSDSGAIPDVIGDAGLIVPENDAHALALALTRLHTDTALRAHLQQAGRRRVEAHFTHEEVAAATAAVYTDMLR